jgi:hypothetical protein
MIYTYVPSSVKCRMFGVEIGGLSKDTFVTIERVNDVTTMRKAQDGQHTAFIDKFGDYRVTFYIDQTHESNEWLHMIFKLYQKAGANLKIPLEVEEKTSQGGTKFTAFDVFFENEASSEFGSDTTDKQWSFICNNGVYTQKGTVETNELVTALQSVVRLIELSSQFGINLDNFTDKISQVVDNTEQRLRDLF